ncbi:alpha-amylase 3, chloroplastic [Cocos nucifera]|uniref:alpha-amylase n=1 Tax=Cocos nucifera TaxID=13894 RepID=A0A8K0IU14_COCNU|nr:alpha-amylase 3, chloroplastic [Cocos nucifera]
MSIVRWRPVLHQPPREKPRFPPREPRRWNVLCPIRYPKPVFPASRGVSNNYARKALRIVRAGLAPTPSLADAAETEVLFSETFPLKRTQTVEGKISVRLDPAEGDGSRWRLAVGCNLQGQWVLHWGVTYCDDLVSEWDQPPPEMRPPGSIPIKDYAIETPLKKSSSALEGQILHEVHIDFDSNSPIAAIHFVLKEEETGAWFQHKGRDFRISLKDFIEEDNASSGKQGFGIWLGTFDQISSLLVKAEGSSSKPQETVGEAKVTKWQNRHIQGFYEEYSLLKQEYLQNFMTVTVRKSDKSDKNIVQFDTDIPGDVVVHWGVCRDNGKKWEIPPAPHPPATKIFRRKALQTLLQPKTNGLGKWGLFLLDKGISGVLFVLKLNEYTWLNNMGTDFYIPLTSASSSSIQTRQDGTANEQLTWTEPQDMRHGQAQDVINARSEASFIQKSKTGVSENSSNNEETNQAVVHAAYADEIIYEIRNLVTDISSGKGKGTKSKEAQENILQEIEKLAAEAYSIFRSSSPNFVEESVTDAESLKPAVKLCSGTGSGFEILCQGFNWESHKSGRWYSELSAKAKELSSLGFTIIWLPPPTESVSPEGYMPKDLYNLNSRYGNMEELKDIVKRFHEVGIKVLGDVVLNHRCAHYQNQNGVWNIFGGRLNWDDRAIVADDPHFQGRGNKSSGDNFHAAPNIDHSQEFVRNDLKEWLRWLRREVGYDGWRLDFVRGFWGGYVKDYLEASEPYFAVGEYWDSLSYTYGGMDHNQDAHRQRIVDWINATNGTAGAFDVTTKGILHTALEKCEYWRLSDQKGKPPGVVGWWPSRAVTFIENHDTGSTQGHWRFPSGKEMQGYAYILTHPGTPAVFYDHVFSHYQQEISRLISLRHQKKIHCRSMVKITKAERDVYAAEIDEKIAVKIGPGHCEPSNSPKKWVLTAEGKEYKVWEAS